MESFMAVERCEVYSEGGWTWQEEEDEEERK
jgi:hypothetical protein